MTRATDRGFEIGKLYRVTNGDNSSYYEKGMIVRFIRDDDSDCPEFMLVKGEPKKTTEDNLYYISLDDLEPVEDRTGNQESNSNKDLLILYVQQHHPLDKVLNALVDSL